MVLTIDTKRLVLGIEYDGSSYHGWQRQSHAASVQSTLEKCLSQVANQNIKVTCAGRTDTGVHATSQVIHFDSSIQRPVNAWLKGGNSLLPDDISIRFAQYIDDDFHARFSAMSRSYLYIIDNHSIKPALMNRGLTWINTRLDVDKMNAATDYLKGEQDFSSFRSSRCQSHTAKRNVLSLGCSRYDNFIVIEITANAFLHHMVRNIVGLLLEIGDDRRDASWAKQVIEARDRCTAGVTAPSNGLYLVGVRYPDKFSLPSTPKAPLFLEQLLSTQAG
ncbi:MAG: tRNA pseudouridine(38-40) synthase TruA [Gammaproteobacteria bacterium]|nr:MAG: tRNA pseudouridine(38-40) synthase TruA [Gammaproteobacteria bacterium]